MIEETHMLAGGVTWDSPIAGARWLRAWRLGEWLREPLSPLFETLLLPILADGRERAGSGRFGFRMPRAWNMKLPSYMVSNGYFFARADPDPVSVLMLPPRFLRSELRGGWIRRWEQQGLPVYLQRIEDYRRAVAPSTPSRDLLELLNQLALDVAEVWYAVSLASGGSTPVTQFLLGMCGREIRAVLGEEHLILFRGFRTQAVEAQQSAFQLAREALASRSVAEWLAGNPLERLLEAAPDQGDLRAFRGRLLQHLDTYGHETSVLDFAAPTLAESPGPLTIALHCYMNPAAVAPFETVSRLARERDEATAQLRARLTGPRRALFDLLLERGQRYAVAREDAVFYLQRGWPIFRRALHELGRRLAEQGTLAAPGDVFFLTADELRSRAVDRAQGTLVGEVSERKALHRQRCSLDAPIRLPEEPAAWRDAMRWPVNLRQLCARVERDPPLLVGTAASPGQVRAPARVLTSPAEFARLQAGDVLVAAATTPSWTPLFSRVGAVVTDAGAITSHSSILAREYGIPAVVGTQLATRAIRDGQVVTVDGTAGKVYLA